MKIWIIEIGEPLPLEKNVRLHRYGQFSRYLANAGHEVTWWTSTFSHAPKQHVVDRDSEFNHDGVNVKLIYGPGYRRNISLARVFHQAHFAREFYRRAKIEKKPDLIISPVPTIDAAAKAVQYGKLNHVPVVTDIRDQWPDVIKNLAPRPFRPFLRILLTNAYRKMSYVCRNAVGIMGSSTPFLEYGLRFAHRDRTARDHLFFHGYTELQIPEEKIIEASDWLIKQGIRPEAFICCFFGTIGTFFELGTVIEVARELEKSHDIQFLLAGTGSRLEYYKKKARDVRSVLFPGWLDSAKISAAMHLSKVGIAPYSDKAVFSLPNKPFEYMSQGLPIIHTIPEELNDWLTKYDCGIFYAPRDRVTLKNALENLMKDESRRRVMGENARALFKREFSTKVIFKQAEAYLNTIR